MNKNIIYPLILTVFFLIILVPPVNAGDSITVGLWRRIDGPGMFIIYPNGSASVVVSGSLVQPGYWVQKSQYDFVWYWDYGRTDFVKISADGTRYTAVNDEGVSMKGEKFGDLSSQSSITSDDSVITGLWRRTGGEGVFSIYPNGSATVVLYGNRIESGRWEPKSQYDFVWYWDYGRTDFVKISADGKSYTAVNDEGVLMNGIKFGELSIQSNPTPYQISTTEMITSQKIVNEPPSTPASNSDDSKSKNNVWDNSFIPFIALFFIVITGSSFYYLNKKRNTVYNTVGVKEPSRPYVSESKMSNLSSKDTTSHHDVFISYSHEDKAVADAICATLESHSIRCWVAPRDVLPGENYPAAIINAIDQCKIMVIVYSSKSNNSDHVIRELTKAVSSGAIIIPFRIEDVPLSKDMEYLIGIPHWLDALTPPLEQHIDRLVQTIKVLLTKTKKE
jgi:hypothetical protein